MKQTLGDMLARIADIEMTITATREMTDVLSAMFVARDGLPADQLILTEDGRKVPQTSIIDAIGVLEQHIVLLTRELDELKNTPVKETRSKNEH